MEINKENEDLFYLMALTFVPGIGGKTGRLLMERFGSASKVFKATLKELKQVEGVGEVKAKGFKETDIFNKAEKELEFVSKNNIQVLQYGYPGRLKHCNDAPLLLYFKGNTNLDSTRVVAIVGTRKNTDYGHRLCDELVEGLRCIENILIVSGLALGIDSIAHKKSVLMQIPTVGVLGHGLDLIYPYSNKGLAAQMVENGGLLTEFPSGTIPDRNNFPKRNRIVAGISDVTVVVESSLEGGALITAYMANGYNRDVAAYPGRVNDTRSAGCNELIRTNIAALITNPQDLIEIMNWGDKKKSKPVQKQLLLDLTPFEQKIIDTLQPKDFLHADELMHETGLTNSELASTLLQLEMIGVIKTLPGKYYKII